MVGPAVQQTSSGRFAGKELELRSKGGNELSQQENGRAIGAWGPLALVGAATVWGTMYSITKYALDFVHPLALVSAQNLLALAVLLPLTLPALRRLPRHLLLKSGAMGLVATGASICLFVGLDGTSPGLSAFIIAQLSIVTPLLAALLGQGSIDRRLGASILLVASGMAIVFLLGEPTAYSRSTLVLPLATLLLSIHMLAVNRLTHQVQALALVAIQTLVTGTLTLILSMTLELWPDDPTDLSGWVLLAVVYGGLVATLGGFLLQTLGQRRTPVTHAGVFISLEGVIALTVSVAVGLESLGTRRLSGFALVLTGTLLAQLDAGRVQKDVEASRAELGPPV